MLMTSPMSTNLPPSQEPLLKPESRAFRKCLEKLSPNVAAELLRYGKQRPDTISLAQGEGEAPTPDFIIEAATKAMQEGKTFYAPPLGIPEFRQEIATYYSQIFNLNIPTNRIFVTASGTTAVHLALTSILDEGDEVLAVTPIWKNLVGIIEMTGASFKEVCMSERDGEWQLDLNELFDACTERTKAILLVTPSNPTGWVMSKEDMEEVMEFARARGIWIVSDEIYARTTYNTLRAPSFLDVSEPDDKLFIVNSFSKSWAMTGWRLGWLIGPARVESKIYDMALYEYMAPPMFTQYGGIAALRHGETFIKNQSLHWRTNLDLITERFGKMERVIFNPPPASFYTFFRIDGEPDSLSLAKRLIDEAGVSMAPGCSFGSGCGDYLRMCFGASTAKINDALDRIETFLNK